MDIPILSPESKVFYRVESLIGVLATNKSITHDKEFIGPDLQTLKIEAMNYIGEKGAEAYEAFSQNTIICCMALHLTIIDQNKEFDFLITDGSNEEVMKRGFEIEKKIYAQLGFNVIKDDNGNEFPLQASSN